MIEFLATLSFPLAAICTGIAALLTILFLQRMYLMVGEEDRAYMDPLSWKLRLVWPAIQIIANFFCVFLPYELMEYTDQRLQRTGVSYLLSAEQFIALRILVAITAPIVVWFAMLGMDVWEPIWLVVAPLVGFLLPDVWLNDTRKRRESNVIRTLPVYLDFITMCVEAGLNFQGALTQAMEKAPPGALRNEFAIVLRDMRSGLARADALRRMAERLDINEITSFVSAIIQAEKMGASLANVLRVQADQRRSERFQRAEKMAMEAPVKLVAPLIIFIFPVTFMILGFPIVMKFLGEGLL
ncbi:MAG: secretion system protein F [Gammaproteobacteria bacterium RIFCSPLOWO2_02_FULL_61_13]|nr:MAG: secretion system protein F [Gammaproteobacteria bacterium RIFCSPLOWO2_02_FULL_61_13]